MENIDQRLAPRKTALKQLRLRARDASQSLVEADDVELTYTSTAIEGNALRRDEVATILATGMTIAGRSLRDHMEIIDHRDGLTHMRDLAKRGDGIRELDIRQMHRLVVGRVDPEEAGRYSRQQRRIAGSSVRLASPAEIGPLMGDLGQWLAHAAPDAETAFLAHERFVTIHPFSDGNGRTGRLLMNLVLLKAGYPPVIIGPEHRAAYIAGLEACQLQQDRGPYQRFMAGRLEASLDHHLATLGQIVCFEASPPQNSGTGPSRVGFGALSL